MDEEDPASWARILASKRSATLHTRSSGQRPRQRLAKIGGGIYFLREKSLNVQLKWLGMSKLDCLLDMHLWEHVQIPITIPHFWWLEWGRWAEIVVTRIGAVGDSGRIDLRVRLVNNAGGSTELACSFLRIIALVFAAWWAVWVFEEINNWLEIHQRSRFRVGNVWGAQDVPEAYFWLFEKRFGIRRLSSSHWRRRHALVQIVVLIMTISAAIVTLIWMIQLTTTAMTMTMTSSPI